MSDLLQKKFVADLQRATEVKQPKVGDSHLLFGVLLPAAVLAIELATHMCAEAFFDPVPTIWHALLIGLVPASNFLVWYHVRQNNIGNAKWVAYLSGAAIAVAGFYALLFLPLVPIAVVAIVFYGLGLLPLAPLAAFASALKLRSAFLDQHKTEPFNRPVWAGLIAGLALLLALDVPAAITRVGIQWAASSSPSERENGLTLLRTFGDDDLLLRLCYDTTGRPSGLLSWLVVFGGPMFFEPQQRQIAQSTADVREIFYRVTGEPFNARPAPYVKGSWARFGNLQFDNDLGGTQAGGRIKGLDLVSSRLDGSVAGDDAVAYLEWMFEFRNKSPLPQEARLELALPPGAVVSRATLWINGEEREAAYGGREETRAAYQKVAVQQRRDPLLVTTKGADRVLAQAFPVPRDGTIKFKIGMTAPLDVADPTRARLTLPAIVDRNFSFTGDGSHNVWIESKTRLETAAPGLASTSAGPGLYRLAGSVTDLALARTRQSIAVERAATAGPVAVMSGDGRSIRQAIVRADARPSPALMIVVDGSAHMAGQSAAILEALDKIPASAEVGLILAQEPLQRLPVAPWSDTQKRAAQAILRQARFQGGQDNTAAIAEALQSLEAKENAALLWIHAPQPVSFRGSSALLEQATVRLARLPKVTLYAVEPGPNALLPDGPWAWSAHSLPQTGSVAADLGTYFARTFAEGPTFEIARTAGDTSSSLPAGSDHIVRLWAADRVLSLMRDDAKGNRAEAMALATANHLVTPVSGAVVLETQRQYAEAGLSPTGQATVPTVPEPHEWALIIIACLALGWLAGQQRQCGDVGLA